MTFSPFYMGNHVEPYDIEEGERVQSSYTKNENWGGQINFMIPLDGAIVEQCKAIGKRQEEKMRLDYELVRALKCAELQTKGFMIRPKTRVYYMCSDIIPIAAYLNEKPQPPEDPKTNGTNNQADPTGVPKKRFRKTIGSRFTFGLRQTDRQ